MLKEIKLSEVKNLQNLMITKSGELCCGERILFLMLNKMKGRKPTFYTAKGEKVIIDIIKDDIEKITYCDGCGFQTVDLEAKCPKCGEMRCIGYRIKGTQHNIYEDSLWDKLSLDFKKRFTYLDKFKHLKEEI